jgi:hypothetical protein
MFKKTKTARVNSAVLYFQALRLIAEEEGLFQIARIHCFLDFSAGQKFGDTEKDTTLT